MLANHVRGAASSRVVVDASGPRLPPLPRAC
jgi:hypothetical protein